MAKASKKVAGFSVVLTGDKELDRMMAKLPAAVQKKPIRKALRDGAKRVLLDCRKRVPVRTGLLKRSLRVRAGKRTRKNVLRVNVQTSASDNLYTGQAFYGAFIEFGTQHITAKPFMRPAAEENRERVKQMFINHLRAEVPKLARQLNK